MGRASPAGAVTSGPATSSRAQGQAEKAEEEPGKGLGGAAPSPARLGWAWGRAIEKVCGPAQGEATLVTPSCGPCTDRVVSVPPTHPVRRGHGPHPPKSGAQGGLGGGLGEQAFSSAQVSMGLQWRPGGQPCLCRKEGQQEDEVQLVGRWWRPMTYGWGSPEQTPPVAPW